MRRREFTVFIGGAAAFPLVAHAQQKREPRKVGVLFPGVLGAERVRLITEGLTSEPSSEKAIAMLRLDMPEAERFSALLLRSRRRPQ